MILTSLILPTCTFLATYSESLGNYVSVGETWIRPVSAFIGAMGGGALTSIAGGTQISKTQIMMILKCAVFAAAGAAAGGILSESVGLGNPNLVAAVTAALAANHAYTGSWIPAGYFPMKIGTD